MPLLPKNENIEAILPNPKESYSVSEAYSSVYKAVIEASANSFDDSTNENQEIPFCFTIGYASSLVNFALACIVDAEKILEELKKMQIDIASCNPSELEEKLISFDNQRIKKVEQLVAITNRTCFNVKVFEKEKQSFSLVLTGKITKKLNFLIPNAQNVIDEMLKLNSAESLTSINFELIEKEILSLKQSFLEEHVRIKKAREDVMSEQIDTSIASIDEVKDIIEKLKDTMINKPKLINLNQSNISKNTLINIRKL